MRDSTAVKLMVTMRSVDVGRTFLNESIALIRVSEPPYMFSAVTEIRPSVEKIRAIAAEAVEEVVTGGLERRDRVEFGSPPTRRARNPGTSARSRRAQNPSTSRGTSCAR